MILQQRQAKQFAGWTVAEMIRMGCSAAVMRAQGVPRTVFYWSLGARTWETSSPAAAAWHLIAQLQPHSLGLGGLCPRSAQSLPADGRSHAVFQP